MPVFEYQCDIPSHRFETLWLKYDKEAPTAIPCPYCGAQSVRVISVPAVAQFKGSGFHATDYAAPTKPTPKK